MRLLAIDPGNTESGWCVIDTADCRPLEFGKWRNDDLIRGVREGLFEECDGAVIEMIGHYGIASDTLIDNLRKLSLLYGVQGPDLVLAERIGTLIMPRPTTPA